MDILAIFAVIAAIVFIGFFAEIIFKKYNIPDVLLLIFVGIIIGSYLKWANQSTFGNSTELFTTFALIFLLFQGALSIDFKTLLKSLSSTVKLTILSFLFTVVIVFLIANVFLGYDFMISILMGMILAGTSSAVVIPLVSNVEIKEKHGLVLTLESAISDVLCIIGTVTVLEVINTGKVVASGIFHNVLASFSLALIVGTIIGIGWVFLLHKLVSFSKSYMLTIAVVVGLYAFVESPFVQGSGAIAALAFGLVVGNSKMILSIRNGNGNSNGDKSEEEKDKKKKTKAKSKKAKASEERNKTYIRAVLSTDAKNFYSEISFFIKTFFFVYLGILIDFSNPQVFLYGALLTLGIFLIRPFAVKLAFRKENLIDVERAFLEILIPKGLAAAVLAGVAVQTGVLGDSAGTFVNLILSVVLLSITLTSILVFVTQKGIFKGFIPYFYSKNK